MYKRTIAILLAFAMPGQAFAGPLREAVERASRELAVAQPDQVSRSRGLFWTSIALMAGGGMLVTLGGMELIDDEHGPDDGEDLDESDDGEDSDGWGNKALIGGGIAAAAVGGILLLTGREKSSPVVSMRHRGVTVHHSIRF